MTVVSLQMQPGYQRMNYVTQLRRRVSPQCGSPDHAPRIPHLLCLTTGLEVGGAEIMLYNLLARLDRRRFTAEVVSLREIGPLGGKIMSLSVPVRSLGMRPGIPNPIALLRLARWLRSTRPDLISTWMYHADLLGGLAAKLAGGIPVVWGIHQSDLSREGNAWLTLKTIAVCARLSKWLSARVICSSEASRRVHVAAGYAAEKMITIPNGFDLHVFKPSPEARQAVRKQLEIPDDALLIGLVGRFHPQKDHRNFLEAAALLSCHEVDIYFLLCGDGVTWENLELVQWVHDAGIHKRCRLLGRRDDIPSLTAALDIAVSSSFAESFANVIGEAMSCEIPCVVTDVGDSALLVGDTGRVVPPKNASALSACLEELIEMGRDGRKELGAAARHRIREHYDLPRIVRRYETLYEELAGGGSLSAA